VARTSHTSINDLAAIGHELAEAHLNLAAGGLKRQPHPPIGPLAPTYGTGVMATNRGQDATDACSDPFRL